MNLSKTQWMIVAVIAAVAVWYFFLRKKDAKKESGYVAGGGRPLRPDTTNPTIPTNTGGTAKTLSYCVCPAGFLSTSTGWVINASGNKVSCYCPGGGSASVKSSTTAQA